MPRRKKSDEPLTVEAALGVATEIAGLFDLHDCAPCAAAIAKKLGKDFRASFERLVTSDGGDLIGLLEGSIQASQNKAHVGIRLGDTTIDNLLTAGVPASEWASKYVAGSLAPLLHESRPIQDFFGRGFLTKEFNQWVFGTPERSESDHG